MAGWDSSRLIPWNLREEQEHSIELEAIRLAQLQLGGRSITSQLGYSMDQLKVPEGPLSFP